MSLAHLSLLLLCLPLAAETITVSSDHELREALPALQAGDSLLIKPGNYQPGISASGLHGEPGKPIIIGGLDPENPPHFAKGNEALHFSNCSHLVLKHLRISGQKHNGLNVDDGGNRNKPAHHITISHVHVSDIGPKGNFDGIKLSGLEDFDVNNCTVEGWGGQAIDMVGCHRGVIHLCTIRGKNGYSQNTGPQTKGGCRDIVIHHNRFENAGGRPIHAGGSTGLDYFRPPGAKYEARNIEIHNNLIIGGICAAAFTGLDGGSFHHNTVVNTDKWIFRILQETNSTGFPPCRNVEIHHNIFQFQRSKVRGALNIGPSTEPESFRFHHNLWFASDKPSQSKTQLPAPETDSLYGLNPLLAPDTFQHTAPKAKGLGITR